MANTISDADVIARKRALEETKNQDGTWNIMRAATKAGIARPTMQSFIANLNNGLYDKAETSTIEMPKFVIDGDDEEPIDDLLGRFKKAHVRAKAAAVSRNWYEVKVAETKPYGVLWFGDPHLGPHCNWDALERDIAICQHDGVYAANIGDTTDNWPWTGRMARLWAENDISKKTERRLACWFMFDAGIKWLLWIGGNHDEWNGGMEYYKLLGGAANVPVIDWKANFVLVHNGGAKTRLSAAHGRKGQSLYNPLHGTLRDAKFGEEADVFVTGHIHQYGLFDIAFAERKMRTWLAQIAGYKIHDHYALVNGYSEAPCGQSMFMIVWPDTGQVQCFGDTQRGADFLQRLRA